MIENYKLITHRILTRIVMNHIILSHMITCVTSSFIGQDLAQTQKEIRLKSLSSENVRIFISHQQQLETTTYASCQPLHTYSMTCNPNVRTFAWSCRTFAQSCQNLYAHHIQILSSNFLWVSEVQNQEANLGNGTGHFQAIGDTRAQNSKTKTIRMFSEQAER